MTEHSHPSYNALPDTIKIGTRRSPLAMKQAEIVRELLLSHSYLTERGKSIEICPMTTKGDEILDRNLAKIGGKGLFTEAIEEALQQGAIHIAVHSMKDMPVTLPAGLQISSILEREDNRDAFLSKHYASIDELPHAAIIGTSSSRRAAQIRLLRPDISIVNFRGNVQTRLKKLHEKQVDATFLAVAGLNRLGLQEHITEYLEPTTMLPAIAQGAIGLETIQTNEPIIQLVSLINHADSFNTIQAERLFLQALGGDCTTPTACHIHKADGLVTMRFFISSEDASNYRFFERQGAVEEIMLLAQDAGEEACFFAKKHGIIPN